MIENQLNTVLRFYLYKINDDYHKKLESVYIKIKSILGAQSFSHYFPLIFYEQFSFVLINILVA